MAGTLTSAISKSKINLAHKKFAIIVASWNEDITEAMYNGAYNTLISLGAKKNHITRKDVPGSFELPYAVPPMAARRV